MGKHPRIFKKRDQVDILQDEKMKPGEPARFFHALRSILFQMDVSHPDMRAKLVFTISVAF